MKSGMLGLAFVLALPVCGTAQTADPATRELIEKLLARIDSLEKRVAQLEQANPSAGATAPASAVPAPAPAMATGTHSHDQAPVDPAAGRSEHPGIRQSAHHRKRD